MLSQGMPRFVRIALAALPVLLLVMMAAGPAQGDSTAGADSTQNVVAQVGSSSSGASATANGLGLSIKASAGIVNHLTVTLRTGTVATAPECPNGQVSCQLFTDTGAIFPKASTSCKQLSAHSFICPPDYYDFVVGNLSDKNDYFSMGSDALILVGAFYSGANHYFYGGTGNDTINGGRLGDGIRGSDGNDILRGGGGRDLIRGGDGRDTIKGGTGGDSLYGNRHKDNLYGNIGNDQCRGGSGTDKFHSCEFAKQ